MEDVMAAAAINSIDDYIHSLRATFSAQRAGNRAVVVQLRFTGRVAGPCYFVVEGGRLDAAHGTHSSPSATVDTDFDLWMRFALYQEDALLAYQAGQFVVAGDVDALLESDAWFVRPAPMS
jgi:hypothetical protein